MSNLGNRARGIAGLLVLWICLVDAAGCGHGLSRPGPITKTATVGHVVVTVRVDRALGREGPCVHGLVTIQNTGKGDAIIFNDPTLPKVICTPEGEAVVFYGLTDTERRGYALWSAIQELRCYVLEPDDSFRYRFTVWNPLDETDPYGNPWYDDPDSKHYPPKMVTDPITGFEDRVPAERVWQKMRVRIGYVDLSRGTVVRPQKLDKYNTKIYELEVRIGDTVYGALWLQEEVVVTFDFGDGHR